ncbi:MAG: pyruvate:ferredoxin (flavodoxin) oxidoreductase [Candidatus Binatia bacterium]|nr:pyruvate:ferredoxin (flavodoxin) oxidoreductase [Candidatus Binatia bacterium]
MTKATQSIATMDGNEAVASVAYRLSEVIAIYPITPASPMGEWADEWAAKGRTNLWGAVPRVIELQSEAGAIAAIHGAIQTGTLATSFTASQGLLLMIPDMFKIAGELTPFCLHVAARTVATHALSIFGDHSDVMACRATGFALLCSSSVQEAQDLACIAHCATLESRIPFLHFFDGFRTSHEIAKIYVLSDDDLRALVPDGAIAAHRARALTPDRPVLRGSAHNPDTYFQAREAVNPFYDGLPNVLESVMARFAARTGRNYRLYDYYGHPEAERVIVAMGSACETASEVVDRFTARGERVGLMRVRLFRPFSALAFLRSLPKTVRAIAVLDRTKEPGAGGEPLYQEVATALVDHWTTEFPSQPLPSLTGGRYGLASKEFTPEMVQSVFAEMRQEPHRKRFTVGIVDDVTHLSLPVSEQPEPEPQHVWRGVFYGLGSDGTVSANKNSVKIIGERTPLFVQAYFVYDSKKAGSVTVSHLRFSPQPIRSAYLIREANFVACHRFSLLDRQNLLEVAAPGATVLLNAPFRPDEVWNELPREVQDIVLERQLRVFTVDAQALANRFGLGGRINTIMQICFFKLTNLLTFEEAFEAIQQAIFETYGRFGDSIATRNVSAVRAAVDQLHAVPVGEENSKRRCQAPNVEDPRPFVRRVTAALLAGLGNRLPVSAFPVDGTWPTGTAKWEKRNIALEIPAWDPQVCIQCNKCALACPHAAIRAKVYPSEALEKAPPSFLSVPYKGHDFPGWHYTIQVAPEDCTGCRLCYAICPAKDRSNPRHKALEMVPQLSRHAEERNNYDFFLSLPDPDRTTLQIDIKTSQFLEPLFEYSGACAGCGETPYIKLLTQLFGDRLLIANATGCSSIYGGNLPTTPYTVNPDGRGPAWSNSLFEDNAEFALGMRLALDHLADYARLLLRQLATAVGHELADAILHAKQSTEADIAEQRFRVSELRRRLAQRPEPAAKTLSELADYLVRKTVWAVGGDGWAYDIGFGGLDHVLASGADVNILVLDTEVYSNTGGQQSKATPLGAAAKFAIAGKSTPKKDLGMIAMAYGHVYVARLAFAARDQHTLRAFLEAESYAGPSLLIAYSHCIAHGYDLAYAGEQQRRAVQSGYWPIYRFDPRRIPRGENPLQIDMPEPRLPLHEFTYQETRFRMVEQLDRERFRNLLQREQEEIMQRFRLYEQIARIKVPQFNAQEPTGGHS